MAEVYIPIALRRIVIVRARGLCEYCHTPQAYFPDLFEFEHVIPRSLQGLTTAENLAFACAPCNRFKGCRTTVWDGETGRRVRLFNPRLQQWERHFGWSDDYTEIIGRTVTGRATIAALYMNREPMRRLRQMLLLIGAHPALPNVLLP
jgi:hypothetical protein